MNKYWFFGQNTKKDLEKKDLKIRQRRRSSKKRPKRKERHSVKKEVLETIKERSCEESVDSSKTNEKRLISELKESKDAVNRESTRRGSSIEKVVSSIKWGFRKALRGFTENLFPWNKQKAKRNAKPSSQNDQIKYSVVPFRNWSKTEQNNLFEMMHFLTDELEHDLYTINQERKEGNLQLGFQPFLKENSSNSESTRVFKREFIFRNMRKKLLKLQKRQFEEIKIKLLEKEKSKRTEDLSFYGDRSKFTKSSKNPTTFYFDFLKSVLKNDSMKNQVKIREEKNPNQDHRKKWRETSTNKFLADNKFVNRSSKFVFDLNQAKANKIPKKNKVFKAKKRVKIEEYPDDYFTLHPYDLEEMNQGLEKIQKTAAVKLKVISETIEKNNELKHKVANLKKKISKLESGRNFKNGSTQTCKSIF